MRKEQIKILLLFHNENFIFFPHHRIFPFLKKKKIIKKKKKMNKKKKKEIPLISILTILKKKMEAIKESY